MKSKVSSVITCLVMCLILMFLSSAAAPEPIKTEELTVQERFRHNIISTFQVDCLGQDIFGQDFDLCCGTGVGISPNLLITAYHVVANKAITSIWIVAYNENGVQCARTEAKILKTSAEFDLCVLITPNVSTDHYINILDNPDLMHVGDKVYLIGNAMGFMPTDIRSGYLSAKSAPFRPQWWCASVTAAGGVSGCCMYDEKTSKCIGIVLAKFGKEEEIWMSGFVPMVTVKLFLIDIYLDKAY